MLTFIQNNAGTLIVGAIVLAIIAAVVAKMIKDRKKDGAGCACGCENCSISAGCGDADGESRSQR